MWVDLGIFFKYLTLWKDALLRTAAEIEENRADRRSLANLLVSWPKLGNCEIDSTLFFILAQSKHSIKRPLGTCSQNYPDDERCDDKIISFLFFLKTKLLRQFHRVIGNYLNSLIFQLSIPVQKVLLKWDTFGDSENTV